MGIREVLTAPRSPLAESVRGTAHRLDPARVPGSRRRARTRRHLRRILTRYLAYYHGARTHLSLDKDAPDLRPIQRPDDGESSSLP